MCGARMASGAVPSRSMLGAALGKLSSATPSPSGTTGSIPDLVWKRMTAKGATRAVSHKACADARVACPQRSTSVPLGVNQRRS